MTQSRKLSHPDSEITRFKLLWRNSFSESDRDYWRQQFETARSRANLRQELREKCGIALLHDQQLKRFCRWVDEQDLQKHVEEQALCDQAELEAQGLSAGQLRDELVQRMKIRALARGDFKLGIAALRFDFRSEDVHQARRRADLKSGRLEHLAKTPAGASQAGLMPEKIA